jgi:hypothetical protein
MKRSQDTEGYSIHELLGEPWAGSSVKYIQALHDTPEQNQELRTRYEVTGTSKWTVKMIKLN